MRTIPAVFCYAAMFCASLFAININPVAAGTPNRQPQLASGFGMVALTFASGPSIYFARSDDGGRTFSAPVKVADTGALAAGRHRGPRVVILKDSIVISAVAGEKVSADTHAHGLPADGDLMIWRSRDRGKTWSRSGIVNDVPGATREGLHAMAADAHGNLFAVWLDLRAKGTQLYGARSDDGGVTWSRNVRIYTSPDGTICECCDPSVAIDEHGEVSVMWRNVLNGSRDLYTARSRDGLHFDPPRKLGQGTWKLNGCPMDGGGLVIDHGKPVSAWRRDGEVFLEESGQPEKPIGTGKDVAIASAKTGVYVAWSNGPGLEILTPGSKAAAPLAAEGAFVNLAALPDGAIVAAWEANGSVQTRRLEK